MSEKGHPGRVMEGDIQTVMYRILKNTSECVMEAYEMADAEGTESESTATDYYVTLSKIHEPICMALGKIREAAFIHSMSHPDGENPLAGTEQRIEEELKESFARILELEEDE